MINVRVAGSGRDVVLIHGWGMNAQIWGAFGKALEQTFTVHYVELPGHGMNAFSDEWNEQDFFQALQQKTPIGAIVIAWSLGGLLALGYAAAYPQAVSHLILVASTPCFVRTEDWSAGIEKSLFESFEASFQANNVTTLSQFALLITKGQSAFKKTLKKVKELIHDYPVQPKAGFSGLRLLSQLDYRKELAQSQVPTLMIYGEHDQLIPVEGCVAVEDLNVAIETRVINKAAHVPFISHQEEVLAHVHPFLKTNKVAR